MVKKYISIAALVLVVVGLSALAVQKWHNHTSGLTLSQAVYQRDKANFDLKVVKGTLASTEQTDAAKLKNSQTNMQAQINSVCASLKQVSPRTVNANCPK